MQSFWDYIAASTLLEFDHAAFCIDIGSESRARVDAFGVVSGAGDYSSVSV